METKEESGRKAGAEEGKEQGGVIVVDLRTVRENIFAGFDGGAVAAKG